MTHLSRDPTNPYPFSTPPQFTGTSIILHRTHQNQPQLSKSTPTLNPPQNTGTLQKQATSHRRRTHANALGRVLISKRHVDLEWRVNVSPGENGDVRR